MRCHDGDGDGPLREGGWAPPHLLRSRDGCGGAVSRRRGGNGPGRYPPRDWGAATRAAFMTGAPRTREPVDARHALGDGRGHPSFKPRGVSEHTTGLRSGAHRERRQS